MPFDCLKPSSCHYFVSTVIVLNIQVELQTFDIHLFTHAFEEEKIIHLSIGLEEILLQGPRVNSLNYKGSMYHFAV